MSGKEHDSGWYFVCEECLPNEVERLQRENVFLGFSEMLESDAKCDICGAKARYEVFWDTDVQNIFDTSEVE